MPDTLTYRTLDKNLAPVLRKAAGVWNDVLSDLVELREWVPPPPQSSAQEANVKVLWGRPGEVRNETNPTRVAFCRREKPDDWRIVLAPEIKWAISSWSRFFGNGEDALVCLIHELGHVFKLPHASDLSYVMHPEIGGSGRLSRREKEHYRSHFLRMLEDE